MEKKVMKVFKINAKVQWNWLGCSILGLVQKVYFEPVVKTIKSKNIKRNGSKDNPAYLVKSEEGNFALKLHSELKPRIKRSSTS